MKRFLVLLCCALLLCPLTASAEGLLSEGFGAAKDALSDLLPGDLFGKKDEKPKDFKELMDSYEAFFDEYIAFMETFDASSDDMSMMLEYASLMEKYAEAMEALDEIDEEELTDEEDAYYLEVMMRINLKLYKYAESIK